MFVWITWPGQPLYSKSKARSKPIHSFDCFDTLVGRLHGEPHSVFRELERILSYPGFADLRVRAEAQADEKTLRGIYDSMQRIAGFSDEKKEWLRKVEFATELQHFFPIQCTLRKVCDGDIVVTDTYFTKNEIHQILRSIGLNKKVKIHSTYDGKFSGAIWKKLKNNTTLPVILATMPILTSQLLENIMFELTDLQRETFLGQKAS